ncbi:MAG: gliding motility lipoprotein GldD [Bacteroidota bacterium]
MKISKQVLYICILLFACSCSEDEVTIPKPKGYYRIDLPKKEYITFDSFPAFKFQYPVYAKVVPVKPEKKGSFGFNIEFHSFNGTIYMTYFPVQKNLKQLLDDQHEYVNKHLTKATDVRENRYTRPGSSTYAVSFDIKGSTVASPVQFYITDSTRNFLRGSLYFNNTPNNDSLSPVIDYLRKDIDQLINTLEWK